MLAYVHCRVIVEAKCLITHDSWSGRSPQLAGKQRMPSAALREEAELYIYLQFHMLATDLFLSIISQGFNKSSPIHT